MPEHLESGTVNVPGIAGLRAGIRFVRQQGEGLYRREIGYVQALYDQLSKIPEVILYTPRPEYGRFVPLLSCNVKGFSSEETASELGKMGDCCPGRAALCSLLLMKPWELWKQGLYGWHHLLLAILLKFQGWSMGF